MLWPRFCAKHFTQLSHIFLITDLRDWIIIIIIIPILQVRKLTPRERESRCKETGETQTQMVVNKQINTDPGREEKINKVGKERG